MPIATRLRRSPGYLYLKLYLTAVLVSVFAAQPLSRRISPEHARQIGKLADLSRSWADKGRGLQMGKGNEAVKSQPAVAGPSSPASPSARPLQLPSTVPPPSKKRLAIPFALKSLASDADTFFPHLPSPHETQARLRSASNRLARVLRRWGRRAEDLASVRAMMEDDLRNKRLYPELEWNAHVRRSRDAHPDEKDFVALRRAQIAASRSLERFLQDGHLEDSASTRSEAETDVHPDDVPLIAIGGSGGGYRAMLGFTAALDSLKKGGAWDVATWVAGVSGSCWSLAGLYTIGALCPARLLEHYKAVAHEGNHPMSRGAMDVVARSRRGVYFLMAPLLAKARSGVVGLGVMDLYATMTSCYQLLSRSPHARPRLSRTTFQWSRVAERNGLREGGAPLPILTAVRRVYDEGPATQDSRKPRAIPSVPGVKDAGAPDNVARNQRGPAMDSQTSQTSARYQWWKMSPFEVGSADIGAGVPTWSFGRTFDSGRSTVRQPEISLSLLLGYCTSAPAGPLTGYISALLATIPRGTVMAWLLSQVNRFVRMQRWERRWGNPIRGADEPNPFFALVTSGAGKVEAGKTGEGAGAATDGQRSEATVRSESARRAKLMDSGLSNNLPNHIFATSSRRADIIVAWDGSSDVKTGAALDRIGDFAMERGLLLRPRVDLEPLNLPPYTATPDKERGIEVAGVTVAVDVSDEGVRRTTLAGLLTEEETLPEAEAEEKQAEEMRTRYRGRYAQVLDGWRVDSADLSPSTAPGLLATGSVTPSRPPDLRILYCPLLPHASLPTFDPTTATFSTSYNLLWTPEQIDVLAKSVRGATSQHVVPALRELVGEVTREKRMRRLGAGTEREQEHRNL